MALPGALDAYIDEGEFDRAILDSLKEGDADRMADYFDRWRPSPERAHLRCYESFSGGTGLTGGHRRRRRRDAKLDQ